MKAADLIPEFRLSHGEIVLDWKRFALAFKHYKAAMASPPSRWTPTTIDAETKRLSKALSAGTLRRDLACLRVFAGWLVKRGKLAAIPAFTKPAEPPPRVRYLSTDEMRRIVAAPAPGWFTAATRIAMLSGQRIGAVLGLRWPQIANGIIDFNAGRNRRGKNRGAMPITEPLAEILAGCEQGRETVIVMDGWRPVTYGRYLAEWRRACKAVGVEGATPHAMRHGVASALVAAGVPLIEVSKLLGHRDSRTTERVYAKFSPEYTRRAIETMGGLVG